MRRALVVAAVVSALAVVAGCGSSSKGYSGDVEGAFMESCTHREFQPVPLCRCVYEEITKQLPFDRYLELDKQMQKDDSFIPDELERITADCASRVQNASSSSQN